MTGRDQGRLDEADAAIGQKTSGVRADAGSPTAMDALLKNVKVQYGRLDVVVASAVVDAHAPLGMITEEGPIPFGPGRIDTAWAPCRFAA